MVDAETACDEGPPEEPCAVLEEGVPYVQGWMEAAGAVAALRDELTACGLDERFGGLRAEVTVAGVGVVELGRITPATARALARLLAVARQAESRGTGGGRAAA